MPDLLLASSAVMRHITSSMLHIAKLAVGVASVEHLGNLQWEHTTREPPLRHRTRHAPRRRTELLAGGSLYWVVVGAMCVRQLILDVVEDRFEDGSAAAAFILDPTLIRTSVRSTRPFQGWRYLLDDAAPPDLAAFTGANDLPPHLQAELHALCLI